MKFMTSLRASLKDAHYRVCANYGHPKLDNRADRPDKRNRCATDREQTAAIEPSGGTWVRLRTFVPAGARSAPARQFHAFPAHS